MHLFDDYLHPFSSWLMAHPEWGIFITFLVSFSESLAIVGSIVPGTVIMTAIGILAGSGIMRVDYTLLSATLGAIAGDSTSFYLGYRFRDRIIQMWPFSHYPRWITYGKNYFEHHGGKSVLIGRFVGPLRSLIPVIAGMMHMKRWHFLTANVISAVGWSIVYVVPGILIGAASSGLSAESATRLFVLILLLLISIWILSTAFRWLFYYTHFWLTGQFHNVWRKGLQHPHLTPYFRALTPLHEKKLEKTAALIFHFCLCACFTLLLTLSVLLSAHWVADLNRPVHLFLQSLRVKPFDVIFIYLNSVISPWSLSLLSLSLMGYFMYRRDGRTLYYWVSLNILCVVVCWLLSNLSNASTGSDLTLAMHASFPDYPLTFATTLFSFLHFFTYAHCRGSYVTRLVMANLLILTGIGIVYLGNNSLSGVMEAYLIGLMLGTSHWIFYRRVVIHRVFSSLTLLIIGLAFVFFSTCYFIANYPALFEQEQPQITQHVLSEQAWWNQRTPILPLYGTNRIGQRISLFNLQFAGSIIPFQSILEQAGWHTHKESFIFSLIKRASGENVNNPLPLMSQLYINKKPILFMTYSSGEGKPLLVLQLWPSYYYLSPSEQQIWIGHVEFIFSVNNTKGTKLQTAYPLDYLAPALSRFYLKKVAIPSAMVQTLPHAISPNLLLIKQPLVLLPYVSRSAIRPPL